MSKAITKEYPTPKARAFSALTFIGATLGFCAGAAVIVPMHGVLNIGPWALMILGMIVGGLLGAVVSPLFSTIFKADSALREKPKYLKHRDPVTGRKPAGPGYTV